ncbi:DNA gyrase subunit A, partial [archaeon]|nr:DNA gyrase subunit A [archaeon]
PALLLNGSSGIAVGMATSIPPHNCGELINSLIALVDNPDLSLEDIMKILPGPDFPTGGIIFSGGEIEKAYATGRGIITIRGKLEKDQDNNRDRLIITEIPYTVNKADLVERIANLTHEKKIEGIANIRDESNKDGMRVVIDLKKGSQPEVIENQLYKLTNMQTSFSMNMLAIHNGRPRVMGILELLQTFLDFREEVVTRRSLFELNKAKARVHILEGLLKALDHIDEIVSLIKASSTPTEAKDNLMVRFAFSDIQAQAILDMRLQRLTGLEREKIVNEYNELCEDIKRLENILSDRDVLMKVIRTELEEIRGRYSDERRSLIVRGAAGEFEVEDLIPDETMAITMTRKGYIKRTELDKYRTQKRGGVGVKAGAASDDDF